MYQTSSRWSSFAVNNWITAQGCCQFCGTECCLGTIRGVLTETFAAWIVPIFIYSLASILPVVLQTTFRSAAGKWYFLEAQVTAQVHLLGTWWHGRWLWGRDPQSTAAAPCWGQVRPRPLCPCLWVLSQPRGAVWDSMWHCDMHLGVNKMTL